MDRPCTRKHISPWAHAASMLTTVGRHCRPVWALNSARKTTILLGVAVSSAAEGPQWSNMSVIHERFGVMVLALSGVERKINGLNRPVLPKYAWNFAINWDLGSGIWCFGNAHEGLVSPTFRTTTVCRFSPQHCCMFVSKVVYMYSFMRFVRSSSACLVRFSTHSKLCMSIPRLPY